MRDTALRRYYGVVLSLVGATATGWLALTGRLALYIHPRYVVFTTIMSAVAVVLIVSSFALLPTTEDHSEHEAAPRSRRSTAAVLILVFSVLGLLLVPPATLSVETAEQRKVNQTLGSTTMTSASVRTSGDADYSHFRLRDWAAAIQLAADPAVLTGRPFDETGFVAPAGGRSTDVFYIARFVVTCCAVDAQPVGVPVYAPGWRSARSKGSWVHVSGTLGVDPRDSSRSVVIPQSVNAIDEPDQPYEH